MQLEVVSPGAFASLRVALGAGETFVSESGLMVRMSASIDTDVTTRPKGSGGVLSGLKRLMGGDSFFMTTYSASAPGEVVIAPTLPGDVHVMELDLSKSWLCAGGSYMASGSEVALEPQFQGMKGLFSGESMFFLQVSGRGPVAVSAYGKIRELDLDGELVVDTGHVVAYEAGIEYTITKAGSSWISSFLAGEGLVMNFSGRGKLLIQSHNPGEFGRSLGPKLPERN